MATEKQVIAVFFGGRSPEHDVSIVTGLQAADALDPELYEVIPVYITARGEMLTGDALLSRDTYIPAASARANLSEVHLDLTPGDRGRLMTTGGSLFQRAKTIEFDTALLAFHGLYGEDGRLQGALEMADIAYTGMRAFASTITMDKVATKRLLGETGIAMLPFREITRPAQGLLLSDEELKAQIGDLAFPCIIKPSHLGSSIGVARISNREELAAVLPGLFKYDSTAILEPFVENMVEYNLSVARMDGALRTSAIEKPKRAEELLDFKQKYLSGGNDKGASKSPGSGRASEGMLSLTRELNPEMPAETEERLRGWACTAYAHVHGTGAPRLDFIGNEATGEFWLNEVNPCPGSFAYFLWEAAEHPMLFSDLLEHLINEAAECRAATELPDDPTPEDARLFPRRS
jgi:D-alanine-D-alanine ligase